MADQASDTMKCHWVKLEDGQFALIPGCWDRVHNPEAECTCGQWSASQARQIIKNMRSHIYLARHENQILRTALRAAGLPSPDTLPDWTTLQARQRRRAMHRAISGDDNA